MRNRSVHMRNRNVQRYGLIPYIAWKSTSTYPYLYRGGGGGKWGAASALPHFPPSKSRKETLRSPRQAHPAGREVLFGHMM